MGWILGNVVDDDLFILLDGANNSRALQFQLSPISVSTTRTYLTPDLNGEMMVIATHAAGQIPFAAAAGFSSSASHVWDNVNGRLGLGDAAAPTAQLDFTVNALGVTPNTAKDIALINTTAAANGAQQISPGLRWSARGWKTTSTAASQTVEFRADVLPVQGTTNPTGFWRLRAAVNGASFADKLRVGTDGTVLLGTGGGGGFLGDFTNPILQFESNSAGFYLDSGRLFFKAQGLFGGGFTSGGFVGNGILVNTITAANNLTTPKFVPHRLNATSLKSGLSGNSAGDIALTTNNLARLVATVGGNIGVGTPSPSTLLDVNSDKVRVRTAKTPSSASDTGDQGDICWDANYLYICTATNTWRRVAHATW